MEITSYRPGTPCWVDLSAPDPGTTSEFYAELFGWTVHDSGPDAGGYRVCTLAGRPIAGIGPSDERPPGPTFWTTYVATTSADSTAEAVRGAGGQVRAGPVDVFDAGRMALCADPTGADIALWQAREHLGSGTVNEPGTPCWHELATRDPERATEFYSAVFGWEAVARQIGGADYRVFRLGDREIGGMIRIGEDWPAEVPPHWLAYFAVADLDRSLDELARLGGAVLNGPHEIEPGRFAVVRDPAWAVFGVIQPAG
ncbi:VOC family protein [Saccharopolyspora sp. MS10]|uniref:VOC family protein n=1 Tax=Saccharopolyspora sp. MS10 TaxID=3385973 RepID=UPI00399F683B